jgi:hypothetical protein
MPSFDAYFEPYEQGAGSAGQAFVSLPEEIRHAVREEVWRDLGDAGGRSRWRWRSGSAAGDANGASLREITRSPYID